MKLKIETAFTDKYNGKTYRMGDEIEFAPDRAKELLSDKRHLVSVVEEDKFDEQPKKPRTTKKK